MRTGGKARRLSPYLYDLQHLHSSDLAVTVQVVHVEGPVELLLEAAARGDGQGADELSEVDGAIAVLVKGPEGMLGELGGVAVREELQRMIQISIRVWYNMFIFGWHVQPFVQSF